MHANQISVSTLTEADRQRFPELTADYAKCPPAVIYASQKSVRIDVKNWADFDAFPLPKNPMPGG